MISGNNVFKCVNNNEIIRNSLSIFTAIALTFYPLLPIFAYIRLLWRNPDSRPTSIIQTFSTGNRIHNNTDRMED